MLRGILVAVLVAGLMVLLVPVPALASSPSVRVALTTSATRISVESSGPWTIYNADGHTIESVGPYHPVEFTTGNGLVEAQGIMAVGPVAIVKPSGGHLTLNGRPYRGYFRIEVLGDLLLTINVVDMEEYLYGVVPREMPGAWHMEALKAQAVAARTFAMRKILDSVRARYDVVSTQLSQVYGGIRDEQAVTSQAVDATRGQVVTYRGQPILASYHASSGGHTENVENVWTQSLPYLRGVPDVDQSSPFYSWTAAYTFEGIKSYLDRAGLGVGDVYAVDVGDSRGVSGRALEVTVTGSDRIRTLSADLFRRTVGLRSTLFELEIGQGTGSAGNLRHTARDEYVVILGASAIDERRLTYNMVLGAGHPARRVLDASILSAGLGGPAVLTFSGGGWGHGVGMSQYGARELAERGHSYAYILTYYYQGVELSPGYGR